MSLNLHLVGKRPITFKMGDGTEGSEIQERVIELWQTSSDTTRQLIRAQDPIQAYKDWVMSCSQDETEPLFAEDDLFCEREPIGTWTRNPGRGHCEQITAEIEALERQGFTIEAEMW